MENRLHNPLKPEAHETTRVPEKLVTHKKNRQSEDLKHVETIQSFSGSPLRLLQKNRAAAQGRICVQCLFPTVEEWSALADCHCSLQGSCCKASSVHFVLCRGKKLRCCPPLLQPGQLRKKIKPWIREKPGGSDLHPFSSPPYWTNGGQQWLEN